MFDHLELSLTTSLKNTEPDHSLVDELERFRQLEQRLNSEGTGKTKSDSQRNIDWTSWQDETLNKDFYTQSIVLTCYFRTKKDPQRDIYQDQDSYEYIAPWYQSMVERNLSGVIFYDQLSATFIEKYQTPKIRFLRCQMGPYSINDERYCLYFMYLCKYLHPLVLMTDVSDVWVNKNPFDDQFLKVTSNQIFIGRDDHDLIGWSPWCRKKMMVLDQELKTKNQIQTPFFPVSFYRYPVYNPGLLGGNYRVTMNFLAALIEIFLTLDSKGNNNFLASNYLCHRFLMTGNQSKMKPDQADNQVNWDVDNPKTDWIMSGLPYNSRYKKEEKPGESEAFLIHK